MGKKLNQDKLGDILSSARLQMGWSRARLSKATGISENSIVRYEKAGVSEDGQYPPAPKLAALTFALGLNAVDVMMGCLSPKDFDDMSSDLLVHHPYGFPLYRSFLEEGVVYAQECAKLRVMVRALLLERDGKVSLPPEAVEWIDDEFYAISREVEKDEEDDIFYVVDDTDDEDFPFELPKENGPDQSDPSHSQSVPTISEAAPTASPTDKPKKGDDR